MIFYDYSSNLLIFTFYLSLRLIKIYYTIRQQYISGKISIIWNNQIVIARFNVQPQRCPTRTSRNIMRFVEIILIALCPLTSIIRSVQPVTSRTKTHVKPTICERQKSLTPFGPWKYRNYTQRICARLILRCVISVFEGQRVLLLARIYTKSMHHTKNTLSSALTHSISSCGLQQHNVYSFEYILSKFGLVFPQKYVLSSQAKKKKTTHNINPQVMYIF